MAKYVAGLVLVIVLLSEALPVCEQGHRDNPHSLKDSKRAGSSQAGAHPH